MLLLRYSLNNMYIIIAHHSIILASIAFPFYLVYDAAHTR